MNLLMLFFGISQKEKYISLPILLVDFFMKSAAGERPREAAKEITGVNKGCNHRYGLFVTRR